MTPKEADLQGLMAPSDFDNNFEFCFLNFQFQNDR
jgi:hypothetical protein